MCIGLPMKLIETNGVTATVERAGQRRHVAVLETHPSSGATVLVHLGTVLRVLTEDERFGIEAEIAELDPGVEHHHIALSEEAG